MRARSTDRRGLFERGAAAVGDDTLQRRSGARVDPESFTHGTSAQRQQRFGLGFQSGDRASYDTFAASGF